MHELPKKTLDERIQMDTTISLETSKKLKGIAILMMVSMHLMKTEWMNNPPLLLDPIVNGEFLSHILAESLHASTAIFAFLTGYAWGRYYKNPIKKIASIYISFWVVALCVNLPVVLWDSILIQGDLSWLNLQEIVASMMAVSSNISTYCWYISFYALAAMTFHLFDKLLDATKVNAYL